MKPHTRTATGSSKTITKGILIGTGTAILISLLLSMGLTSLILKGSVPENNPGIYIFLIRTVSVMLGSMIATTIIKEKYLQVVGIVTVAYLLFLLGSGIILYNGSFHNFGVGLLSVIIGGGIACILKVIPQKKKFHLRKFKK